MEMDGNQRRAFDIWIGSATIENNFNTISLNELEDYLEKEGLRTSSSALGRWKKKFDWDKKLEDVITTVMTENSTTKKLMLRSSLSSTIKRVEDDMQINQDVKTASYSLIMHNLNLLIDKVNEGGKLSDKELRFVNDTLKITADREDKLLDRQAASAAARSLLNPEEALKALQGVSLELEDDVSDADIVIEE